MKMSDVGAANLEKDGVEWTLVPTHTDQPVNVWARRSVHEKIAE